MGFLGPRGFVAPKGNLIGRPTVISVQLGCFRPSAGFKGALGARAQAFHQQGPPTKPFNFWLMIDVSLVILIEDFEINKKLCTLPHLLLVSTALLTFALDDLAFTSTPFRVKIRLRMHQNYSHLYTKE